MVIPAFDSVMALWEAAMQRPMIQGNGATYSGDERMLVGLLDGSISRGASLPCVAPAAQVLDIAIASTRLLLARLSSDGAPQARMDLS